MNTIGAFLIYCSFANGCWADNISTTYFQVPPGHCDNSQYMQAMGLAELARQGVDLRIINIDPHHFTSKCAIWK